MGGTLEPIVAASDEFRIDARWVALTPALLLATMPGRVSPYT